MDMEAFIRGVGNEPSFDEERMDLAAIFESADAGNIAALRHYAEEYFHGRITTAEIENAIAAIIPLQYNRRLEACVYLTQAYSAAQALVLAQKNYICRAAALARIPDKRDQAASEMNRLAREFERLSMNEYSRGLRFMRDLRALDIPAPKAVDGNLFAARTWSTTPKSVMDLDRQMTGVHARMTEQYSIARQYDLEIAQFKAIMVGATLALDTKSRFQRDAMNLQYLHARDLFDGTAQAAAPGAAELEYAIKVLHIMAPFMQATENPALKI